MSLVTEPRHVFVLVFVVVVSHPSPFIRPSSRLTTARETALSLMLRWLGSSTRLALLSYSRCLAWAWPLGSTGLLGFHSGRSPSRFTVTIVRMVEASRRHHLNVPFAQATLFSPHLRETDEPSSSLTLALRTIAEITCGSTSQ